MKLIFATDSLENMQPLHDAAISDHHEVLKVFGPEETVTDNLSEFEPEVVLFCHDRIDDMLLADFRSIHTNSPMPMLVFTRDSDEASIGEAVRSGVSAYIVGCEQPERLTSLLLVAKSRFAEQQRMISELEQARSALEERKLIEKAKGIVMRTRNITEEQAYGAIRKLAMNRNQKIADISAQIISAAEVMFNR